MMAANLAQGTREPVGRKFGLGLFGDKKGGAWYLWAYWQKICLVGTREPVGRKFG